MRLAGNANWWAPAPLRRIYERVGISEHGGEDIITLPKPAPVEPAPVVARSR
jgi:RND superfamily putative drug exporter